MCVYVALRSVCSTILFFFFSSFSLFRSSLIIGSCACVLWLTYLLSLFCNAMGSDKVEPKWMLLICVDKTEIFLNTSFLVLLPSIGSPGWAEYLVRLAVAVIVKLSIYTISQRIVIKLQRATLDFFSLRCVFLMLTINDYIVAFLYHWSDAKIRIWIWIWINEHEHWAANMDAALLPYRWCEKENSPEIRSFGWCFTWTCAFSFYVHWAKTTNTNVP